MYVYMYVFMYVCMYVYLARNMPTAIRVKKLKSKCIPTCTTFFVHEPLPTLRGNPLPSKHVQIRRFPFKLLFRGIHQRLQVRTPDGWIREVFFNIGLSLTRTHIKTFHLTSDDILPNICAK